MQYTQPSELAARITRPLQVIKAAWEQAREAVTQAQLHQIATTITHSPHLHDDDALLLAQIDESLLVSPVHPMTQMHAPTNRMGPHIPTWITRACLWIYSAWFMDPASSPAPSSGHTPSRGSDTENSASQKQPRSPWLMPSLVSLALATVTALGLTQHPRAHVPLVKAAAWVPPVAPSTKTALKATALLIACASLLGTAGHLLLPAVQAAPSLLHALVRPSRPAGVQRLHALLHSRQAFVMVCHHTLSTLQRVELLRHGFGLAQHMPPIARIEGRSDTTDVAGPPACQALRHALRHALVLSLQRVRGVTRAVHSEYCIHPVVDEASRGLAFQPLTALGSFLQCVSVSVSVSVCKILRGGSDSNTLILPCTHTCDCLIRRNCTRPG